MRYPYRIYILLLTTLLFFSCRQEEPVADMESGFLLTLGETNVMADTRSTPAELGTPVADNFNVHIVRSTGEVIYDRAYTSQLIPASADSYTLTASYGTDVPLGLDAPYYEGVATATVEKDKQTAVRIACGVANALITVKYVDADTKEESTTRFDHFLSDYKVRVEVGNRGLYLPHDSKQSVYFPAGSVPYLQFQGVLRETEGKEIRYDIPLKNKEGEDISFEAGTHVIISLSYAAIDEAGAAITVEQIEVKTETISENIPVSWLPRPWVEGIGFEDKVMTHYETEEVPTTQLNFPAAIGLDDVKFTIAFDDETYKSLNGDYVLSEMTDEQKQAFADAGISLPEIGNPEKTTMDFTNLINKLSGNPDTTVPTVDNIIKITGVTANDKEAAEEYLQDYKIAIKAKPVFTIDVQDYNVWSKEFTADDPVIKEGYAEDIKAGLVFQYSQDGGNTWYDCSQRHVFTSHPIDADRDILVRAKFRNFLSNEKDIVLEEPKQVPNGNMDSWTNSTRDVKITAGSTKQQPIYYPWIDGQVEQWWDTNNNESMLQEVTTAYLDYKCFPTTTWVTHDSGKAAVIRSVSTYTLNSQWMGSGTKRGILYVGTTDYDGNRTEGKNFESRPTALTFQYMYDSYDNERFGAYIEMYNGSTMIASGTYTSTNGTSVSSYAECKVSLTYSITTLKATSIRIRFYSVADGDEPATRRVYITLPNESSTRRIWGGSVLTIDDISLVYDK